MNRFDVIVVGGRISGSATAIRLAQRGYKVAVIEKSRELGDTVSTHFMNPRGMSYLKALGVLEPLLKTTPKFKYFDVEVDAIPLGGEIIPDLLIERLESVHPEEQVEPIFEYACIQRTELDPALKSKAESLGVRFYMGTLLESFEQTEKEVTAVCSGNGIRFELKSQVLLGADGKNSKVAQLLNLRKKEEKSACTFACYTYFEGLNLPNAIMKKRNRISFAAAPTSHGKTMVLVFGPHTYASAFRSSQEINFTRAIQMIDPDFAKKLFSNGKRAKGFRFTVDQQAFLRERPSNRIALLGDAHSFKDQCTANGMSHALRDAFLVSSELDCAFRNKKSLGNALSDFNDRRHLDLFRFYEFTSTQAEMNPLRAEEERLYKAISDDRLERNRFISLYFDVESPKNFFQPKRIEKLALKKIARSKSDNELRLQYQNPFESQIPDLALEQTCFDYAPVSGPDLLNRTDSYFRFYQRRKAANAFQYSRTLHAFPGTSTKLSDDAGRLIEGINFASQDYLGLGKDEEIKEAALSALNTFGPHSAGSPMVIGNTLLSKKLEESLKELTGKKHVILFPTGYAAGMGSLLGIVRPEDHIVMDRLSHACLQQGARAATRKIHRFPHLDADSCRAVVKDVRSYDAHNAILILTEGLFSMDADSPDLKRFQEIAREFNAYLFVDVAHDLGSTGPNGTGQIGEQGLYGKIDFVMGSFSKTFASNGGFLATDSESLLHYLRMYSTPHLFSNALSPIQAAVALKASEIIQSRKGDGLRKKLSHVVGVLRNELIHHDLTVLGEPSPIVPVMIGSEQDARLSHRGMTENQMAAMIIEYPIVPLGAARYRLQVMASHTVAQAVEAAKTIALVRDAIKVRQQGVFSNPVNLGQMAYQTTHARNRHQDQGLHR